MRMMRKVSTLMAALEHLDETDTVYSVDETTGAITELRRSAYLALPASDPRLRYLAWSKSGADRLALRLLGVSRPRN